MIGQILRVLIVAGVVFLAALVVRFLWRQLRGWVLVPLMALALYAAVTFTGPAAFPWSSCQQTFSPWACQDLYGTSRTLGGGLAAIERWMRSIP